MDTIKTNVSLFQLDKEQNKTFEINLSFEISGELNLRLLCAGIAKRYKKLTELKTKHKNLCLKTSLPVHFEVWNKDVYWNTDNKIADTLRLRLKTKTNKGVLSVNDMTEVLVDIIETSQLFKNGVDITKE
jgi:hypothetical protein